ncbi:MAG: phage virion morphogenesis protein [Rhodocyclaceae bacterium]|nr:phage virion morphogenesis protein [Rhodocyclaceae bacterium]
MADGAAVDGLTVTIADAGVDAALARLAGRIADPSEVLDAIGAALEARVQIRFERKVDPAGQEWEPLGAGTRAAYDKQDKVRDRKGGQKTVRRGTLLERSGRMLASLSHLVAGAAVDVGFGVPYAQYHETGTEDDRGDPVLPRRGMLTADPDTGELGADDAAALVDMIDQFLGPQA